MAPTKEVSVGEFDACTGLTHITLQRGRLMFNMGPPSTKRAAAPASEETVKAAAATEASEGDQAVPTLDASSDDAIHTPTVQQPPPRQRVFRSGVFTGRSLYAEEAVYLVQRAALVVYEMEKVTVDSSEDHATLPIPTPDTRQPLSLAQLLALVVRHCFATLAACDVYTFLKDNKLHSRRHGVTPTVPASDNVQHLDRHEHSSRLFLFDVFKSITETQYVAVETPPPPPAAADIGIVPSDASTVNPSVKMRKRKIKRLKLIFCVGVSAFQDAMPRPRDLRRLMDTLANEASTDRAEGEVVPLKLAVANADRSVLLFEVA